MRACDRRTQTAASESSHAVYHGARTSRSSDVSASNLFLRVVNYIVVRRGACAQSVGEREDDERQQHRQAEGVQGDQHVQGVPEGLGGEVWSLSHLLLFRTDEASLDG